MLLFLFAKINSQVSIVEDTETQVFCLYQSALSFQSNDIFAAKATTVKVLDVCFSFSCFQDKTKQSYFLSWVAYSQLQHTKANLVSEHTPGYSRNTCLGKLETSQKTQMRKMKNQEARLNDQARNKTTIQKIQAQPRPRVSPGGR